MKAALVNYYSIKTPHEAIIHNDVEDTGGKIGANRMYRCRCCGHEWVSSINSPLIMDEDVEKHIAEYYPNRIDCTEIFK